MNTLINFLCFGLRISFNLAKDFCIGQDLGYKCLEIIVILDPVSRRPENLLPLILIFIFGQAYSDTNDVHKDYFWSILLNLPVHISLEELIEMCCQQRSIWSRLWFFQWSHRDVRVGL